MPRLVLIVCLALLSAPGLNGCDKDRTPLLRVGTNLWPGYAPLYLARSQGLLDTASIRLVELPSATQVMHELRNDNLEAAALTLDETLSLLAEGLDLRVVLVLDFSAGGDVLMAPPGVDSLKALKGRRVGVEGSAVGAIMLDSALQAGGLSIEEVEVVPVTLDRQLVAFRSGEVEAVVTFEPIRTKLLASGALILFDSSRIPGRIVDVLVVREGALSTHEEPLRALIQGHFEALEQLRREPVVAATRMAPRLGLSPDELLAAFAGMELPGLRRNRALFSVSPSPLEETTASLASLMLARGLLAQPISATHLFDGRWLPEMGP